MTNYAVITGSYNTGSIAGNKYKGGIAGNASVCAAPQGCYNVGAVEPGLYSYGVLGNLSGTDYITIVHGSFYLAEDAEAATDTTATGAASAAMKASSFVSKLNLSLIHI